MRPWLFAGHDVAVGVAAHEVDLREREQGLDHLDRAGAEQHEITECPPTLHADVRAVGQHGAERSCIAVHVGDHSQPHQ